MESGKIYGAIYENNFNEEEEDVCLGDEHGEFRVRFYLRSMENFVSQFLIVLRIGKLLYDFLLSLHRWGNLISLRMYHEILNWIILNR